MNGQLILEESTKIKKLKKKVFYKYLKLLFESLSNQQQISEFCFTNVFTFYPYIFRKKLYDLLVSINNEKSIKENFINTFYNIIYGNFINKIKFFFFFFSFEKEDIIHIENVKIIFLHFHYSYCKENIEFINKTLEYTFNYKSKLSFNELTESFKLRNSDLFYLFYFFLIEKFCNEKDIYLLQDFINEKNKKMLDSSFTKEILKSNFDFEYDLLITPTENLFMYLNNNLNLNLIYKEDFSDLNDLIDFEYDLTICKKKILNEINSIESTNDISSIPFLSYNSIYSINNNENKQFNFSKSSFQLKQYNTSIPKKKKSLSSTSVNGNFIKMLTYNLSSNDNCFKDIFFSNDFLLNKANKYLKSDIYLFKNSLLIEYNYVEKNEKKIKLKMIIYNNSFIKESNVIYSKKECMNLYFVKIENQINPNKNSCILYFKNENSQKNFIQKFNRFSGEKNVYNKYKKLTRIGKGAYGQVYLIIPKDKNKKKKYALKIVNKIENKNRDEFETINFLSKINHINIIKCYEIFEDINSFYYIYEYCQNEIFFNLNTISFEEKFKIFKEIINGIEFLHSIGIIHRDLKQHNLLLGNDNNIKIIDFGFSKIITPFQKVDDCLGSFGYFPPEIINGNLYSFEVDYWNIGIISYIFLYDKLPFKEKITVDLINQFHKKKLPSLRKECNITENFKAIVKLLLVVNKEERRKNYNFILKEMNFI